MKIKWVQTCNACPEQYDLYNEDTGKLIGYVRERHGMLTVNCPYVGDELVFGTEIDEENESVMSYQTEIEECVKEYYKKHKEQ